MSSEAAELAHRLARHAEAVCRYYLSSGRREGHYASTSPATPIPCRRGTRLGLLEGDRTASEPGPQRRACVFFPCRLRRHSSRSKKASARRPPLTLRPLPLRSAVQTRPACRQVIATKATMGAADPTKEHHHGDRSRRSRPRAIARLLSN
jgi:hypothetical protein